MKYKWQTVVFATMMIFCVSRARENLNEVAIRLNKNVIVTKNEINDCSPDKMVLNAIEDFDYEEEIDIKSSFIDIPGMYEENKKNISVLITGVGVDTRVAKRIMELDKNIAIGLVTLNEGMISLLEESNRQIFLYLPIENHTNSYGVSTSLDELENLRQIQLILNKIKNLSGFYFDIEKIKLGKNIAAPIIEVAKNSNILLVGSNNKENSITQMFEKSLAINFKKPNIEIGYDGLFPEIKDNDLLVISATKNNLDVLEKWIFDNKNNFSINLLDNDTAS